MQRLANAYQKQSFADVLQIRCSSKFCHIHRKTPVLESLFNKVAGLMASKSNSPEAVARRYSVEKVFLKISQYSQETPARVFFKITGLQEFSPCFPMKLAKSLKSSFLQNTPVAASDASPFSIVWDKVFKNGPSKICGRQPLKIWSDMVPLKFFTRCLSQILLGPFLNTLSHIEVAIRRICVINGLIKFKFRKNGAWNYKVRWK